MNKNVSANLVGIFDSGIGGLSVLREIRNVLPFQPLYYVADQAHVPYGKRKLSEIENFAFAITNFLIEKGAQIIVVACNTASAAALKALRQAYPHLVFIGMEPAVKPASQSTHNGVVGVLATPATFQGELYHTLVEKFAHDVKILTHTCPGLVEAIEAGEISSQSTKLILKKALIPMIEKGADTIVLGCTHFPFIVPLIKEIVGPKVAVIDPSPAIAKRTSYLLNKQNIVQQFSCDENITFATSKNPEKFKKMINVLLDIDASPISLRWKNGSLSEI
ncbi:MAG: glutamate racemase [Anaerolineaceae bacterium]|nr:glutamate racemase [Anaerolineaceae bacterium]